MGTAEARICAFAVCLVLLQSEIDAAEASCNKDEGLCFLSSFQKREDNIRIKLDSLLLRLNGLVSAVQAMQTEVMTVLQDLKDCQAKHMSSSEVASGTAGQVRVHQDKPVEQEEPVEGSEQRGQIGSEGKGEETESEDVSFLKEHEEEETFGARLIMPIEQELLHVNAPHYVMELFTPARGNAFAEISIDDYVVVKIDLLCSHECTSSSGEKYLSSTGGRSPADSCTCLCTRNCDCSRCMRATYSEMVRVEGDAIEPGQHTLTVDLTSAKGEKHTLQTFFFVVPEWIAAFTSFLNATADLRASSPGTLKVAVSAPAHVIPGLTYSMLPGHALGAGALWPGIAILRPRAGEQFRQLTGVRFELELLDFEWRVDGFLQASLISQINDGSCSGFYGCPLSKPLPLQEVIEVQSRHSKWTCGSANDCSKLKMESLHLLPGFYRLQVYLADRNGRQMSSFRHRVFSVTADAAGRKEEADEDEAWRCPETHCGRASRTVERQDSSTKFLLLTEWPAIAGISASADRWRMIVDALWQYGFLVHVVSKNCAPYHGDYISKSHRGAGPRSICGISSTDIPALLLELGQLDVVLMENSFFRFPAARSIPQQWIPFLREGPGTRDAKLLVISDQLVRPNGTELDEPFDRHKLHAAGAQLMSFAAADVIAVSTEEDLRWMRRMFAPEAPVLLLRHSILLPKNEYSTPGFGRRKGILFIGAGMSSDVQELELISKHVLPLLKREIRPEDGEVFVFGEERTPMNLQGVKLFEPNKNLREAFTEFKVCLSFSMDRRVYFQPNLLHALAAGVPVVVLDPPPLGLHVHPSQASCQDCQGTGLKCAWPHTTRTECEGMGCCWSAGTVRESLGPRAALTGVQCKKPCARQYPRGSGVVVIPQEETLPSDSTGDEAATRSGRAG